MLYSHNDFEKLVDKTFGEIDRTTLSSIHENRIRLELGESELEMNRFKQAFLRADEVFRFCFEDFSVWLRIVLWTDAEEKNLEQAGLAIETADIVFRTKVDGNEVLYLNYRRYSCEMVGAVIKSIINYEMAKDPSANITCYFINFEKRLMINVYDDRGMDIHSPDTKFFSEISNRFAVWKSQDLF